MNGSYPLVQLTLGERAAPLDLSFTLDDEQVVLHLDVQVLRVKVLGLKTENNELNVGRY